MGSLERGLISGFVCRLCSKMNRFVILIYGNEGVRLGLEHKINTYLPVTVERTDQLPKTVCWDCIQNLEVHHRMMERIKSCNTLLHDFKGICMACS